jgi:crossover junction endodeoxyribonuclease RuvC
VIRPLRMVGLDLSTAATAIASTHDPRGEPFLSVFTIPGTSGRPLHEQIAAILHVTRRSCGQTIPASMWRPDLVVIEGTFSREGAHASDYPLHALHACVKQWLWNRSIPYVDVSPSTLKVWATGRGGSAKDKVLKKHVVEAVIATYGAHVLINPKDDNCADGVALLTLGLAAYGQPLTEVPTSHRRAIKVVKWPVIE